MAKSARDASPSRQHHGGSVLQVDLPAIRQNYHFLQSRVGPNVEVGAAVKADAYGLGVKRVAPALHAVGCRRFFVATRDEAVALREIFNETLGHDSRDTRIYLLNGPHNSNDIALLKAGVSPVINSLAQLRIWKQLTANAETPKPCVLQFDSGMSRYGLSRDEVAQLLANPTHLQGVTIDFIMSHLASADAPSDPSNAAQRDAFNHLRGHFPDIKSSLAASSGLFLDDMYHFDIVRPGYALFGGNPTPGQTNPMQHVAALYAPMIQARDIQVGERVGYGGQFQAMRPSRIATLALGYADGLPRYAGGRISVMHNKFPDISLPCVGRISMDSMAVDITDLPVPALQEDTFFEVIGPHRPLDEFASALDTIGYEVLTSLGQRLSRVYFEDDL